MDRLVLKVPVIGQIMHNSSIARFARTTAVTFKAGVPLVEALGIVAGATGNKVYERPCCACATTCRSATRSTWR
jgi:type IV pilus assembly protein PilC